MTHQLACELKYDTSHLPAGIRGALYRTAYDRGHSSGFAEVESEYDELADLIKEAYEAGKNALE